MSDVPLAEPTAAMTIIDAPSGHANGDARLSYPLRVPPGRHGRAPALALAYDSSANNGALGLGWSLPVSAIEVDTRWGVPRYDPATESESYLLDGAQLTPLIQRGAALARVAERDDFHERVEGNFRRIVRHGTGPGNYTWEVSERDGTVRVYGDAGAGAPPCSLRDAAGHVFYWALREERDPRGNRIVYSYALDDDPGVAGGGVAGRQLYLTSIEYPIGPAGEPAAYRIDLTYDTGRPDATIDARTGAKVVTAQRLIGVAIRCVAAAGCPTEQIRRYQLDYVEGAYRQSLLHSVTERGADDGVFTSHTFHYQREPDGFAPTETWSLGDDPAHERTLDAAALRKAPAAVQQHVARLRAAAPLGGSRSWNIGAHLYVGVGVTPTKLGSAGLKVGGSFGTSTGTSELIDLDGDQLPDKVFEGSDGRYYVRFNQLGRDGSTTFSAPVAVPTLPGISRDWMEMVSGGAEAYAGVYGFANYALSFSQGWTYFTDVNGDGLHDLVHDGATYYNHLDGGGVPTFVADDSGATPVPLPPGPGVDTSEFVEDLDGYLASLDSNPLTDIVRRWRAPFAGTVTISGDVSLLDPNPGGMRDGVRVVIEREGATWWSQVIAAGDTNHYLPPPTPITVAAGDRVYFRVQSRFDGTADSVAWAPIIQYQAAEAAPDANLHDQYLYDADNDFTTLGSDSAAPAPYAGTIRVHGTLTTAWPLSDDVRVDLMQGPTAITVGTLPAGSTAPIMLDQVLAVAREDALLLRLSSDSPVDVTALGADLGLTYVTIDELDRDGHPIPVYDEQGAPVSIPAVVDATLFAPLDRAVQTPWIAPFTTSYAVTISAGAPGGDGTLIATIKRAGRLVARGELPVVGGVATPVTLTIDAEAGDALYAEVSTTDSLLGSRLIAADATFTYTLDSTTTSETATAARHGPAPRDMFTAPHRGWSMVAYNGDGDWEFAPIDEVRMAADWDALQMCAQDPMNAMCDPATLSGLPLTPDLMQRRWYGPNERVYVSATDMSSSRLASAAPQPHSAVAAGRAVTRTSSTGQTSFGVGFLGAGLSYSGWPNSGHTDSTADLLDMNGDQYTDIVTSGHVQYSTPQGALEQNTRTVAQLAPVRRNQAFAWNAGVGGNPATVHANSSGEVGPSTRGKPRGQGGGAQMVQFGVGGDLGFASVESQLELIDMNGDGLPDRVRAEANGTLSVALNLGYGFAAYESWGQGAIHDAGTHDFALSASLGSESGALSVGGGVNLGFERGYTGFQMMGGASPFSLAWLRQLYHGAPGQVLVDVNGDGRPDLVRPTGSVDPRAPRVGSHFEVAINTGSGFAPAIAWPGIADAAVSSSSTTSIGFGAFVTIPIPVAPFVFVIINPGADARWASSSQVLALADIDGDGYPDHVRDDTHGNVAVARNRRGATNLLVGVDRPLGSTITIHYTRTANTYRLPQARWVMDAVDERATGAAVPDRTWTFSYEDGRYDRFERTFLGFAEVVTREPGRVVHERYHNDSVYTHGLPAERIVTDEHGARFERTTEVYDLVDLSGQPATASGAQPLFPRRVRTQTAWPEGGSGGGVTTFQTWTYDLLGRVVSYFDAGDVGPDDDRTEWTAYADCRAGGGPYLLDLEVENQVWGEDRLLERTEAEVDCQHGEVIQVRRYSEVGDDGTAAVTDLAYDDLGNLIERREPADPDGWRRVVATTYGPAGLYPASELETATDREDGYVTTALYDLRFGTPFAITDPTLATTYAFRDQHGRPTAVYGPLQSLLGPATIEYEYHPEAATPHAVTRRLDVSAPGASAIASVLFVDHLGRTIQRKDDATVYDPAGGAAVDGMTVSGWPTYDALGRVVAFTAPTHQPPGTATVLDTEHSPITTLLDYDTIDRPTRVTLPDGRTRTTVYGLAPDRGGALRRAQADTDENGHHRTRYLDVRGRTTAVREELGGAPVWTSYRHDPLDRLIEITDAAGNRTTTAYDDVGQRVALTSPDAGTTTYQYDAAGHRIAEAPAHLPPGTAIRTRYDSMGRPVAVEHPRFSAADVHYTWGEPGAADNGAGRLIAVDDRSGHQRLTYDEAGQPIRTTRTVIAPEDVVIDPERPPSEYGTYTTLTEYDPFGRLLRLVYPDDEQVRYHYDRGGRPRALTGQKAGNWYEYLRRREYDAYGVPVVTELGNGVRQQTTIDPETRFVTGFTVTRPDGTTIADVAYRHDAVGNLTGSRNQVGVSPDPGIGGGAEHTYRYDERDRLVEASGDYQVTANGKRRTYTFAASYDAIDNLVRKTQTDRAIQPGGKSGTVAATSYDLVYGYGARPHAPTRIGDQTFTYDAGGALIGVASDGSRQRRTLTWDDDHRLYQLDDNGRASVVASYDHRGVRAVRTGQGGTTVYVSAYLTVGDQNHAIKYLWVGGTRLAGKTMRGQGVVAEPSLQDDLAPGSVDPDVPYEQTIGYLHAGPTDDVGYVTDGDGVTAAHVEYLPSGETWIAERVTNDLVYRFAGQELDPTGLYAFHHRSYDPRTSQWQRPDPALGEYLDSDGPASVYRPANLSLYSYAWNNPPTVADHDGRVPTTRSATRNRGATNPRNLLGVRGTYRDNRKLVTRTRPRYKVNVDHMPSFAANRGRVVRLIGRQLSKAEARKLHGRLPTMIVLETDHRAGRTWGSKNRRLHQADSLDLSGAVDADLNTYVRNNVGYVQSNARAYRAYARGFIRDNLSTQAQAHKLISLLHRKWARQRARMLRDRPPPPAGEVAQVV